MGISSWSLILGVGFYNFGIVFYNFGILTVAAKLILVLLLCTDEKGCRDLFLFTSALVFADIRDVQIITIITFTHLTKVEETLLLLLHFEQKKRLWTIHIHRTLFVVVTSLRKGMPDLHTALYAMEEYGSSASLKYLKRVLFHIVKDLASIDSRYTEVAKTIRSETNHYFFSDRHALSSFKCSRLLAYQNTQ